MDQHVEGCNGRVTRDMPPGSIHADERGGQARGWAEFWRGGERWSNDLGDDLRDKDGRLNRIGRVRRLAGGRRPGRLRLGNRGLDGGL